MIKPETLRKKGWSEKDIEEAARILNKKRPMFFSERLAPHIYWVSLLLTIVGNLFVSVMMLPFVLYVSSLSLFIVVGVISVTFGSLFNILLKDIEMVDQKHHVIVGFFMPAIALIVMWVIIDLTRAFIRQVGHPEKVNNPFFISAVYAFGFAIPSIIEAFTRKGD